MAFERVLLAVGPEDEDRLEAVVDATVGMTAGTGATVYLLYTFRAEDYESVLSGMDVDATTGELTPDELARRHEQVRTVADGLEAHGVDHEIRTTVGGEPADLILDRIDRLGAEAAVVGGRRRSPAGKAMFGDRAQQVLLNASVPVLYVTGTTTDRD